MKRSFVHALVLTGVLSIPLALQAASPLDGAEDKVFVTSTGLEEHAWLTRPNGNKPAPLVVTLPMLSRTHETYADLLTAMRRYVDADSSGQTAMPYTLNFDLKGHGRSVRVHNDTLLFSDMGEPQWRSVPQEVVEMIRWVISDSSTHIDTNRIIIVGASIGANTAALLTDKLRNISKIALLSPGENYRGLQPANSLTRFKGGILIMASPEDKYSYQSCVHFKDANKNPRFEFISYKGRAHGTNITNSSPDMMSKLVRWIFE